MRIACIAGIEQTGHCGSLDSQTRLAQSRQNKLWPQGTRAPVTSLSPQTTHSRLPLARSESVGLTLAAGDGLEVSETVGNDQMLDVAVEVSKLGDSPSPSSLSRDVFQIETRSPILPGPLELEELLEHDPELEKAPELPVDEVIVGNVLSGVGSK